MRSRHLRDRHAPLPRTYPSVVCDCGHTPDTHKPDPDGGSPCELCSCPDFQLRGRWGG